MIFFVVLDQTVTSLRTRKRALSEETLELLEKMEALHSLPKKGKVS
jgi:hypothetical protein